MLFLIPALLLPVIIGLQGKIKRNFTRAAYHAYLFTIGIAVFSSLIFTVFNGFDFSDFILCLKLSLGVFIVPFLMLDWDILVIPLLIPMIVLFVLLMAWALNYFRKCQKKTIRNGGQIVTVLLFGILYGAGHWLLIGYVAAAAAIGAMYAN